MLSSQAAIFPSGCRWEYLPKTLSHNFGRNHVTLIRANELFSKTSTDGGGVHFRRVDLAEFGDGGSRALLRLDRLRLRGPCGAHDEFLLAATAQNLRKLAKLIPTPAPMPA
jgi:hypothetical protein